MELQGIGSGEGVPTEIWQIAVILPGTGIAACVLACLFRRGEPGGCCVWSGALSCSEDLFEKLFGGFGSGGGNGLAFFEAAEPGGLAFGELAGAGLDLLDCEVEWHLVLQMQDEFTVAEGL